jgi:DNA-directed RNA polymerase sigma subunit (sigma70/sigma32)
VDSQADQILFESEWEEEMEKVAATRGWKPAEFKVKELEAIQRWQADKNPNDFEFLYDNHLKMIDKAGNRYMRSTQLPKAAVRSDMLRQYVTALDSFDPEKGAALSTHVTTHMQHTGRYLQKYQNVGKISSTRTQYIGEFKRIHARLTEDLGREPSTHEIADEMVLAPKEIETLRRELRADLRSEGFAGDQTIESPRILDRLVFEHGSLNPEQQTVLEYTEGMYGRPKLGSDAESIAKEMGVSPQKVRALKKQIWRRVEKYY